MTEINDLHYLTPSGCTFWGKKPWSRKKKRLWQLGTIIGAPVGIALVLEFKSNDATDVNEKFLIVF